MSVLAAIGLAVETATLVLFGCIAVLVLAEMVRGAWQLWRARPADFRHSDFAGDDET